MPSLSTNPALVVQATTVPIVSNISTIEKEITNIKLVNKEPWGIFIPSLNIVRKVLLPLKEKKDFKLVKIFQLIPGTLPAKILKSATFKGIDNNVADKIPIITEPFTLKWLRTVITIKPKRATIAFDKGYIEIYEYPRGDEATITYTETLKSEKISAGDTANALEYEIDDMEKAVAGENVDMHLDFTRDVMDIMTFIRKEWGMFYPEEEGKEIIWH